MKTQKIIGFIGWIFFTVLVALLAVYLILLANGYKVNYRNLSFQKTGMIYLKSEPDEVQVYLDNKLMDEKTPSRLGSLLPGRYTVKISKDKYYEWQKTFLVAESETVAEGQIALFLQNPQELTASEEEKQAFSSLVDQWPPKGLEIKNQSEVWFNDVYVTRFSQEIKHLSWYTNLKHILVQEDKKIVIMDPDGSNIVKLVDLSADGISQFITINSGKDLLYQDGKEIKKIKIQ